MMRKLLSQVANSVLIISGLVHVCTGQVNPSIPVLPGLVPQGQLGDTIPSQFYYQAIHDIYRGEYRDAERTLARETRGAIRIGVTDRWIDSICYHAMWGEVLYHQGRLAEALSHFDEACTMFLDNPRWLLQVNFKQDPRPDTNLARKAIPWGASNRQFVLGSFPSQMLIQLGDSLEQQSQVAQQGGVLRQMQYWQIDVIEIIRATSLAIRRRNELLGPLALHDPISRELVAKLAGGFAPPHHWSNAWADLQLGLAYVGQGNLDQARIRLERAERVAGQFDHPLTCVALLEQGRLAMEAGKTELADELFAESSYSAFYFEDAGIIDEAFRLASINRLASPVLEPNPVLETAANWARHERFHHIYARLCFARAEELLVVGDTKPAIATLQAGQSRLGNASAGLLGNWSRYLEARLLAETGKPTALEGIDDVLAEHMAMSPRTLQLQLADSWFDQQQLRASSASEVYRKLLSDPTAKDWAFRPLETLALLKTPVDASFERWLLALEERKEKSAALEVTDLAKRRRYFSYLPLGGRMTSLRVTLESPELTLTPAERNLRSDLLARFPEYDDLLQRGLQIQESLRQQWQPAVADEKQKALANLWHDWAENVFEREQFLGRLGLSRVACDFRFPPVTSTSDLQKQLVPGQAVVVFHDTSDGLFGFLVTDRASTVWNCGPSGEIARELSQFLRDLGNHDRNSALDEKQLASKAWLESGQILFESLFAGSAIDPVSMDELVVVPDGLVWYVPLAALPIKLEDGVVPLTSLSRVRVVPTMGLAFGRTVPWRRVQHTSLVGQEIVPGEKAADRTALLEPLAATLANRIELPEPLPVATPVVASLLETLVVLDEFEIERDEPLTWSPIPGRREGAEGELATWLSLPLSGPQRLVFAGAHTVVENGGKASRRKSNQAPPGSELFLTSCGLMSTGAQTVLLSRWRVGGQSTLELMREFVQELPRTSASDAWQRCIEVAKQLPLEPSLEPRIKTSGQGELPTAEHPFFWSGYLLLDTGEPVDNKENKGSGVFD